MSRNRGWLCVALVAGVTACAPPPRTASTPPAPEAAPAEAPPRRTAVVGRASWYGAFHHGRRTASGEIFDMHALTAAHRTVPLGTRLRVTNLSNGRSVELRVNDRGPAIPGRILDVSRRAAALLGAVDAGVFPVEVLVLD
jgi:rare lipoprotein A